MTFLYQSEQEINNHADREERICNAMFGALERTSKPIHRSRLLEMSGIESPAREPHKAWVSFYWNILRLNDRLRPYGVQVVNVLGGCYELQETKQ